MTEPFWLNDWRILYRDQNYSRLIPKAEQSLNATLNDLTRLTLLIILILIMAGARSGFIFTGLFCLVLIIGVYYSQKLYTPPPSTDDEFYSGYYDSSGKLVMNRLDVSDQDPQPPTTPDYTEQQLEDYQRSKCRQPTEDNPFMNPSALDYGELNPPRACNGEDVMVADDGTQMTVEAYNHQNFVKHLFTDLPELYEEASMGRNFYTLPYPPDTIGLAKTLFEGAGDICMNDQTKCTRSYEFDDPRFDRP